MGSLQLEILKVLWSVNGATVSEVHAALPRSAELAHTTVATMLRKMEVRGLVRHQEDGRRFVYSAAVTEREVTTDLADDVLYRAFNGSLAEMVQHLLTTRDVSSEELDDLARMIAERRGKS